MVVGTLGAILSFAAGAGGAAFLLRRSEGRTAPAVGGTPGAAGTAAAGPGTPGTRAAPAFTPRATATRATAVAGAAVPVRPGAPDASPAAPASPEAAPTATPAPTAPAPPPPSPTSPPPPPAAPTRAVSGALVRLLHAAPAQGEVAITIDGRQAFSLGFTDVSRYQELTAGAHQVQVSAAGRPAPELPLTLADGQVLTVVIVDVEGSPAGFETLSIEDDPTPPAPGRVNLRVLQAAADAPPLDVLVQGGAPLAAGLAFRDVTPYAPLDGGVYTFEVRPAGAAEAAFATRTLTLDAGDIYTATILGQSANNTLRMIVYPDNA